MDQIASELFEEIISLSLDYIGYTIAQKLFEKCSEMFASNQDAHVVALCAASGHHWVSQERDGRFGARSMRTHADLFGAQACRPTPDQAGGNRVLAPRLAPHPSQLCTYKLALVTVLRIINQGVDARASQIIIDGTFHSSKLVLKEILGDQAHERQIAKDAVQILRDSIGVALHSLSIPINPSGVSSDTTSSASKVQMPELTPIKLSKLISIIISNTPIPSTKEGKEPKLLWTPTVQRATVQPIISRVGQEFTSQIANHCLADAKFNSNSSPIALLYRICSAPVICSANLCKTVLLKTKRGAGPEAEELAEQLGELIELANKYGNEFPINHVS
ncbi:hypothetical protein PCANC_21073 [Puccinia coronata f. sp. avenae]|uniref:Uncharacterized protein n=1 Tax=Puccinia coronata f. sp. avenae TaxID=200324 RepID=A0A2N5U190_9BASI|nr:hypothetical protein PCANC_21073 [Puccinia coronata f. sp. avenae]